MKNPIIFLTKPLVLLGLWISFIVILWNGLSSPALYELLFSSDPLNLAFTLATLLLILMSISLLSAALYHRQLQKLQAQELIHKNTVKQLKKQHQAEKHQIQTLIGNEQFAYWEWDIKRNEAQFSNQWKKMLGLPVDTPLNKLNDLQNRIHPKDKEDVQNAFYKILSGDNLFFECTHRALHEDGHYFWVHDKGQVFYTDQGEIDKLCVIRLDVSEQKWIEGELEVDATIIEHASQGMAIIAADLTLTRCNQALTNSINGISNAIEITDLQTLLNTLQSTPDDSIIPTLIQTGRWRGELSLYDDKGNLQQASRVNLQKIFHETSQSLHYSFIHTDITDLKQTQAALDNLANIDRVTGLANRNRLYHSLENAVILGHPLTLMFLDLDNFKVVNDTLGHDIGDLLLKAVGERIEPLLPEHALLARVGGDEFVLYYPQSTAECSSSELAQQITDKLAESFSIQQQSIHIGSSIGISQFPQQACDRHALMKAADVAMYQAKRAGKGQFFHYDPQQLS